MNLFREMTDGRCLGLPMKHQTPLTLLPPIITNHHEESMKPLSRKFGDVLDYAIGRAKRLDLAKKSPASQGRQNDANTKMTVGGKGRIVGEG